MKNRFLVGVLFLFVTNPAQAELLKLEIQRREPFAGGMAFGDVGPYEKIVGVARFQIDPNHRRNTVIVDLALAPRTAAGKVEFAADFYILAPKDPAKGNGALLYDVNNRGNKLALGMFNRGGGGNEPTTAEHAGDGFLFRRGYTLVWCGWIGELLPGNGRLLLRAPIATEHGRPIRGVVRHEMFTDTPTDSMPLSRRDGHGSYPPTVKGEAEGVLTWRMRETDERVPIPRSQWSLERLPIPQVGNGAPGTLGQVRMNLAGGFRPGYLYELVCEAEGPIVQGVGYAAVRDLISFLRYDASDRNPLRTADGKPASSRAHGFGVSQSGRFLRNYLYLGFNADEKDRKVFDGLMPHVAGGGLGFFNHRFGQPTRHNAQHEEHLYPADRFPFTYGLATDPFTNRTDSILGHAPAEHARFLPKVMHTQSAAEYWHRSGSLVHTDPLGKVDAEIPETVRVYAFGGTQHGPASDPPSRGSADNLANPGDYRPLLRALLDALDAWVKEDLAPPPSVYPRIDRGTLVNWRQNSTGFPALPGVRYPEVIQQPHALDYGPDFEARGLISIEPPKIKGHYVVLVPKSGPDGNDLGCLAPVEVAVPLATYTGWNLRRRDVGAEGQLASLTGSYFPFPKTEADRRATGDPRESIEKRYGGFDDYRQRFAAAADDYVKRRYLLEEDADRLLASREKVRERFLPAQPRAQSGDAVQQDGAPRQAQEAAKATALRFEVTIAPNWVVTPQEGRLLVVLGRSQRPEPRFTIGQTGLSVPPVLGGDVRGLIPGVEHTLDESATIFPLPSLTQLPAGDYYVQAVLHANRDLNLPNAPGNLYSSVQKAQLDPARGGVVKLQLTQRVPAEELPADTESVKYLKLPSELLSKFHGRPMFLRAAVRLPAGFDKEPERRYPLRVHIGGYGTRFTNLGRGRVAADTPPMLFLLLDGAGPFGDPYQVNSANNGPYGDALTQELIPYVEKKFRGIGQPHARFLDGGSTGGWVSLALQIFYPDFFNGCWSSCPDPVDFRAYELINIYQDDNAYVNRWGFERPAMRQTNGDIRYTVRHECQMENVLGRGGAWTTSGKDWCAWNATFGPRGPDGRPIPLWDAKTGKIDRSVTEHWKKYDLRLVLQNNWQTLGPKLHGKVHIWVGDADDYFLNNAVHLLDNFLSKADPPFGGRIEFGPGLGHTVLWSDRQIMQEMAARLEKAAR